MIKEIVRKDFKLIEENEDIRKIFGYIYREGEFPIVTKDKKAIGIIDERNLIKSKIMGNERIKNFVVGVPKIDATYSAQKAKSVMVNSGVDKLIVTSEKEIIGYVRLIDILKITGIGKTAKELMKYVQPVEERNKVGEIINIMRNSNRKFIPVLSEKKFSGVIGIREILPIISTKEKAKDYHPEKTSLLETSLTGLVREVPICGENEAGEEIIKIMEESEVVAVCRGKEYLGLIEEIDLL
ncbi:MAG: CBS domain-containing protein [Thermoplasmatales archaeon]|nr:CBS domain-containing protein [Thermoplasmatales archaeon]